MESPFLLEPGKLTLATIRTLLDSGTSIALGTETYARLAEGVRSVERIIARGEAVYGLNTGFGKLAKTHIADDQLRTLQRNLVLSHAAGTGAALDDRIVRLILILKVNALARGYSGVRPELVDALLALIYHGIHPVIPSKGSVGASGDLAPLAHLACVLIGEGSASIEGVVLPARHALQRKGLAPIELGPKEGLALLNGTQVSTAVALVNLLDAGNLFQAALVTGALSIDAAKGSDTPFDPRLQLLRGQPGQIDCAAAYRALLAGSAIRASHLTGDDRVQDPYCLRCQPQVMGACLDQLRYAARILEIEANAVSDNPLLFPESDEMLSGGNFHAEPVALVADAVAVAIAEIGAIAERRIALLVDTSMSGLPAFLVRDSGLNSGFMIAQVTAAAMASENKSLAHPASVDSLPTSANQEDHVSMASFAAYRLGAMVENTRTIIAIEYLAAAQGIEFHRPLTTSAPLQAAIAQLRGTVPPLERDRMLSHDIESAGMLIRTGALVQATNAIHLPTLST